MLMQSQIWNPCFENNPILWKPFQWLWQFSHTGEIYFLIVIKGVCENARLCVTMIFHFLTLSAEIKQGITQTETKQKQQR